MTRSAVKRSTATHDNPRPLEMCLVLITGDLVDDLVNVIHDGGKVDAHIADVDPECRRVQSGVTHGRCLDQCFRRHAPVPRALSAERSLAHQQHAPVTMRRRLRRREPRRPSPDDGEVEGVAHAGFGPPANTRHALWPPNPNDVVIASRAFTARPTLGT